MIDKRFSLPAAGALLLAFLLSGCAQKQWRDPLSEEAAKGVRAAVMDARQHRQACTCCLDAEITATWDSSFYDGGLIGYLQILLPTSFKLVAINPLGQPLFALTTDGERFQTINAVKGVYKHGRISSFVNRHDMPKDLLHGDWATWLMGGMSFQEENILDTRRDQTGRGIWLGVEKPENRYYSKEYLLFDPIKKELLQRVVFDKDDDEAATVHYREWTTIAGCPLPTSIEVVGSSYNSTIAIELKDIIIDRNFTSDNFYLKLPPGYLRQYYP